MKKLEQLEQRVLEGPVDGAGAKAGGLASTKVAISGAVDRTLMLDDATPLQRKPAPASPI